MPRTKAIDDGTVLDAVARVIVRDGPANVTFARVGRDVGLSPATLVQRFGSKRELLLALARRGAGGAADPLRARTEPPLEAIVEGLVAMSASVSSPEAMANQLAFLQLDLSDPEFHRLALEHAKAVRAEVKRLLESAGAEDAARLAQAIQVTYNGALITWAIYRRGRLDTWLRRELGMLLGLSGPRARSDG
jgi:AcrR family transcriptional regulator